MGEREGGREEGRERYRQKGREVGREGGEGEKREQGREKKRKDIGVRTYKARNMRLREDENGKKNEEEVEEGE